MFHAILIHITNLHNIICSILPVWYIYAILKKPNTAKVGVKHQSINQSKPI